MPFLLDTAAYEQSADEQKENEFFSQKCLLPSRFLSNLKKKSMIPVFKNPYFRDSFFGSQAIWLGSHPEASGHGSSKRRASRGISGFSSLGKIHGLMNQFA